MIKFLYKNIAKPVFFKLEPEYVHDRMIETGNLLGKHASMRWLAGKLFNYDHPSLERNILGIHFKNPVGLAAGFDKDARLTEILPSIGFGFAELGSITAFPCAGNPQPRLWRYPKSKSILVNYGLKNRGSEVIAKELSGKNFEIPFGISIARTNIPEVSTVECGVQDYKISLERFAKISKYITLNISCPNAYGGSPFTVPENLEMLLTELDKVPTNLPIFLKLSPDLSHDNIDRILEVCGKHRVQGLIISNLTKQYDSPKIIDGTKPTIGGLSGKVTESLANDCISYIYKKTGTRYILVGCGGIFSAEDAYLKIKLGASLVQLITGMIYEGPQLIGDINRGLVKLLKKDGYANISEAVGSAHK